MESAITAAPAATTYHYAGPESGQTGTQPGDSGHGLDAGISRLRSCDLIVLLLAPDGERGRTFCLRSAAGEWGGSEGVYMARTPAPAATAPDEAVPVGVEVVGADGQAVASNPMMLAVEAVLQ